MHDLCARSWHAGFCCIKRICASWRRRLHDLLDDDDGDGDDRDRSHESYKAGSSGHSSLLSFRKEVVSGWLLSIIRLIPALGSLLPLSRLFLLLQSTLVNICQQKSTFLHVHRVDRFRCARRRCLVVGSQRHEASSCSDGTFALGPCCERVSQRMRTGGNSSKSLTAPFRLGILKQSC